MTTQNPRPAWTMLSLVTVLATTVAAPAAFAQSKHEPEIDAGFRLLYQTQFTAARGQFAIWQKNHPDDPLGPAAEAASYLFEEFYHQGVFTSEFFLNDKKLLGGVDLPPDPQRRVAFLDNNRRAEDLAQRHLKTNSKDTRALLALTLVDGMQSDYAGLIEKHQLETLKFTRRAESNADKLLSLEPQAHDAYLALGAAHYILACLPGYKKMFLWVGGVHGDRQRGMNELRMAAEGGHYLRPFAKAMLALTALREKQPEVARSLLSDLTAEFPQNPVFAHELAKLNHKSAEAHSK